MCLSDNTDSPWANEKESNCRPGSSINILISIHTRLKLKFSIVFAQFWHSHSVFCNCCPEIHNHCFLKVSSCFCLKQLLSQSVSFTLNSIKIPISILEIQISQYLNADISIWKRYISILNSNISISNRNLSITIRGFSTEMELSLFVKKITNLFWK